MFHEAHPDALTTITTVMVDYNIHSFQIYHTVCLVWSDVAPLSFRLALLCCGSQSPSARQLTLDE
jgi:hypothetical protein